MDRQTAAHCPPPPTANRQPNRMTWVGCGEATLFPVHRVTALQWTMQ